MMGAGVNLKLHDNYRTAHRLLFDLCLFLRPSWVLLLILMKRRRLSETLKDSNRRDEEDGCAVSSAKREP